MGYRNVNEAYGRVLSAAEKSVLLAMAHRADDKTRLSWLARETIAEMTGLTTRTVTTAWKGLEAAGLIVEVTPEEEPREDVKTRVWRLLQPEIQAPELAPRVETPSTPKRVVGGNSFQGGVETPSPYTEGSKRSTSSLRSDGPEGALRINLQTYFQEALEGKRSTKWNVTQFQILNKTITALRKDRLSDPEIASLMDIFADRRDLWFRRMTSAEDFARAQVLSALLDIQRSREEYLAAPRVREVVAEAPESRVRSLEEAREALRRKREQQAPSWAKKEAGG